MRILIIGLNLAAPVGAVALAILGHVLPAVGVLFGAHMLMLYATLMPNCAWLGPLARAFPTTGGKEVWLTIDDGPDPDDTPRILDLLDHDNAKATFFLIGEKAARHPELVREIASRGHGIGNHTQTHPARRFWAFGPRRIRREITACQETLALLATCPVLFRAPAGMRNPFVHPVLREQRLDLVGWTARGYDGIDADQRKVLGRLLRNLRPGAILLVHESTPIATRLLESLLAELRQRGYRCVLPARR